MCDCHPLTPEQREAIRATECEDSTVEDWRELHDLIETYRIRRAARHVEAHVTSAKQQRRMISGGGTPHRTA